MPVRIQALPAAGSGCEYWRVYAPFEALAKQGYPATITPVSNDYHVAVVTDAEGAAQGASPVDAVLLPRWTWGLEGIADLPGWIDRFHAAGIKVLYDLDDDCISSAYVPYLLRRTPEWTLEHCMTRQLQALMVLRACDGVTVSTPTLAERVRQVTDKPVLVVPNAIDWPRWVDAAARAPLPTHRLTVGWVGALRPEDELADLAAAWTVIAHEYPDVQFLVGGWPAPPLVTAVPLERLVLRPWVPLEYYPRLYMGIDIACAPLSTDPFNACRSPIKAFEYAATGATVCYSPTVYGDVMRDIVDGVMCEPQTWAAGIGWLIEHAAVRYRLAGTWAARVQSEFSLAANLHRWPDAWATLVNQEAPCSAAS